ncbi:carbohydrate kinase family protein [Helicovermis profundi]|uniref:Carbohydrate kinase family protein n=1 Tax=Helicovermis profundi TaxID=3065157 RepID=A0AAU9ECM6_9FIRM|nr:carbohydrate kinase family protein [Clostridia bacterium S502]
MFDKDKPYILVLGASVVDIFGFSSSRYRPYNSTPGRVKMSFGGVCRNIAENLARVGVNTKFISILGDDEKGKSILEHSKIIGYDMSDSLILENGGTPTYLAILNECGEMVSSIADMKSIGELNTEFIDSKADIIINSEYTFLDSDDPEILEYILTTFKDKTKFVLDPVSAEKANNIKHLIHHFHTIKPNRHEAEIILGFKLDSEEELNNAGKYFRKMGVKNIFISLDEDGIYYMNSEKSGIIKAENVTVKNVTGAGDSFVAGIGYGYMKEFPIEKTVKFAITMANITIDHEETINPEIDNEYVASRISKNIWIEKKFNF